MLRLPYRSSCRMMALLLAVPLLTLTAQRPRPAPPVDSTLYVRTTPPTDPIINKMMAEGMEHGQAMKLGQVLMDSIGPRLTNSDRFDDGQQWLINMYRTWGIPAKQVQYGTWDKWVRGPTYMDLVSPRLRTLEAIQLGWSPGTNGWQEADVITLPESEADWDTWARNARGKFVLYTAPNPTCRRPDQVKEFAIPETITRIDSLRRAWGTDVSRRARIGGDPRVWAKSVGVAGMLGSRWSGAPGIDKVFGSPKDQVPTIDVICEDYNLLYRLAENHQSPRARLYTESQDLGELPVHNVIARIEGSEKPNEYIVLSAHYDSWDGASGATDNGTGTITMMEAARILKKIYPNPRRTIIIGHWGGEEQGLNGSKGFAEDHPEIVAHVHAGFNQDNGTGRVVSVSPGPFKEGTDALVRYFKALPSSMSGIVRMSGPGRPATGGTDHAAFQCLKSPVYGLGSLGWDYGSTTWHTNRDTFDKVIAEDLQHNATLVAMLTYMADQDPTMTSHDVITLKDAEGNPSPWPTCDKSDRNVASSSR